MAGIVFKRATPGSSPSTADGIPNDTFLNTFVHIITMAHLLHSSNPSGSSAVESARLHTLSLLMEDIVRKSAERNSENLDRVLQGTNRRA